MGIAYPSTGTDTGLYRSPISNPIKIYSYEALFGSPISRDDEEYAYRIFIYYYDDYDPEKRNGNTYDDLDIPNSKSGTYVKRFSDANFDGSGTVINEYIETTLDADKIYIFEYVLYLVRTDAFGDIINQYINNRTYTISVVENKLPLKKWTIADMISRIFDTIKPIHIGEMPIFRLDGFLYDSDGNVSGYEQGSLADKLNKIIAPEMTFTKMNLREVLKQIGGFIHAEPRILRTGILPINDRRMRVYIVGYDFYGSKERSNIASRKYVSATLKTDINEFCTSLDSSADNLVSRLDFAQGVVVEPFNGGYQSLRTENYAVRIEEDNGEILTAKPIDTLYKLEVLYDNQAVDITPYAFESAEYENLSSFEGAFPFAKEYALKYTIGQKNITGLFFKSPDPIDPSRNNYAIVNIIETASGKSFDIDNYALLSFRVTYLPIASARVKTNKQTVIGGIPRTLAYNQGANLIETRYYGEHLKGVVARLGNVEKTYTYNLAFLSDIPKVGTLFNDIYYISAVNTEFLPSYIRCTIALSKDFNRLSQYVGISSEKRMWEVSERQAFERESVITEYVLITENDEITSDTDTVVLNGNETNVGKLLFNTHNVTYPVSSAKVVRRTKNYSLISPSIISLPVISTALGNSMLFTFGFDDNYSAGQKSIKRVNGNITGYWGEYVPYCNYYGRFYYLSAELKYGALSYSGTSSGALDFPQVNTSPINTQSLNVASWIRYRKDSREIPNITYEISLVTDNDSIVIGSALSKNCALVNTNPATYELYGFDERINTVNSNIDIESGTKILPGLNYNDITIAGTYITVSGISGYKAWAIITKPSTTTIKVEDEDGEETTQTIQTGGELVIGQNCKDGNFTDDTKTLYFRVKRDVYGIEEI